MLTVNGTLSANGAGGSGLSVVASGGGSGGSLWLTAATIDGSGLIEANGGDTPYIGGGGSGGASRSTTTKLPSRSMMRRTCKALVAQAAQAVSTVGRVRSSCSRARRMPVAFYS